MQMTILSGAGRSADPWHPYAETSAAIAEIGSATGFEVKAVPGTLEGLAELSERSSLVVVNAGDPEGPGLDGTVPTAPADADLAALAAERFEAALERGIGILVVHSGAAALREVPAFGGALGARWERGRSWHPDQGDARVLVVGDHPIVRGLSDFEVFDERYTDLVPNADFEATSTVLAVHEEAGRTHPLAWARELGRSRLVYSALGHDARSYRSAGHRALLARALRWLSAM
ncbi:ThuA domain-containing protein [Agromyces mediolanus]|uniref:ThuA-like domain-containing protein n=1 Tax=Agromyces mediolanus TaxID=41986 RepID=A0A918FCK9_AGRME|nr:ThuA domain-containing protein [Agromyces mediolanus]GGR27398.1 hypothetical protein GCM10010196_21230 [Agromyces mediolanus]GLJ71919.1 hypothetical protein GCM10017583_11750 [Agromyces mediolanus]